jgi:transposase
MDVNEVLNLRQFKAMRLETLENGDIRVHGQLEYTGKTCPACGKEANKIHQYYQKAIRHLPIFNQPSYLCFEHRLLRCTHCRKLFLERLDFVDLKRQYSRAYEQHIYELCRGQSLNRVAELEGLSWDEVEGIFKKKGADLPGASAGNRSRELFHLVSG